ncbi:metal ABC transporter permease [Thiomicrorhabdus sp. zzn3]|uniref:metal ABC transporter permease n=1 Tax=Thiomicrorhabdus sp. zzn3 TaxID=3039775 RepID=UPI002436D85B|nr:metal ABC transporter permease [Thiomicrorhabdus sp. zzn3]MDG6778361.1 metal ABC transporter permease [Thiomicrorhabdus sp. zzn3]
MISDLWILATASLVAVACSMVGSFLILRRQSLLGDAISHSVLLGIVLAFLATDSRSLPVMLSGAVLIGLTTAWLSDQLHKTGQLQSDASIGIVFTLFFAVGVILISLYAGDIDLDQECVLYGEIAFVPFDTVIWGDLKTGIDLGPRAFWMILIVFAAVLASVVVFYQRLQTVTFHPTLAVSLGINVVFWHYFMMTLVSMTTVASFDAVGAILVVALLVIPASTAYLLAKSLKQMLWMAAGFAELAVLIGYALAFWLDSSISASIAVSAGIVLLAVVVQQQFYQRRLRTQTAIQSPLSAN